MSTLFDLLALFYVFVGLRAIWTASKNWRAFTDEHLTAFDRNLASQLAFFIFVPIGVLLHELGHAVATYQVGGTVDWLGGGFHYALFWGYVIPEGRFTVLQDWWIALSGNLVSVLFGFLPLLILPFAKKAWVKFTLLTFARIQLGWSLVGYPLLTLTGIDSDWSTIYSTRTLLVSAPLFVTHVALVVALFLADRSRWVKRWEVSLYAGGDQLRALDDAIAARPGAVDPIVARGNYFAAQDQVDLAIGDYRAALKLDPQNPRVLYNLGQIRLLQKNYGEAEKNFRAALARADVDPQIAGRVRYGLALCLYHRGKAKEAVAEFSQAIARVPDIAEFYYWRGLALRQTHDDLAARKDFTRVAEMAAMTNPALAQQARQMASNT
ncbi:MAG: tetratricopeptide repeat protein [Chloroflexi bacterium]|nr:tetratricopeptide repeat protein [Chloroflexota bacterium]